MSNPEKCKYCGDVRQCWFTEDGVLPPHACVEEDGYLPLRDDPKEEGEQEMKNEDIIHACVRYTLVELINGGNENDRELDAALTNIERGLFSPQYSRKGVDDLIEEIKDRMKAIRKTYGSK